MNAQKPRIQYLSLADLLEIAEGVMFHKRVLGFPEAARHYIAGVRPLAMHSPYADMRECYDFDERADG